jgi:hypothetical protein
MPENDDNKTNELLINWSKWLISINLFAAMGCIMALKTAGDAVTKTGIFFFAAIFCFCISLLFSTLFVFLLSGQALKNQPRNSFKIIWLAKLQWLLFSLGVLFVLVWISVLSKVVNL